MKALLIPEGPRASWKIDRQGCIPMTQVKTLLLENLEVRTADYLEARLAEWKPEGLGVE